MSDSRRHEQRTNEDSKNDEKVIKNPNAFFNNNSSSNPDNKSQKISPYIAKYPNISPEFFDEFDLKHSVYGSYYDKYWDWNWDFYRAVVDNKLDDLKFKLSWPRTSKENFLNAIGRFATLVAFEQGYASPSMNAIKQELGFKGISGWIDLSFDIMGIKYYISRQLPSHQRKFEEIIEKLYEVLRAGKYKVDKMPLEKKIYLDILLTTFIADVKTSTQGKNFLGFSTYNDTLCQHIENFQKDLHTMQIAWTPQPNNNCLVM